MKNEKEERKYDRDEKLFFRSRSGSPAERMG